LSEKVTVKALNSYVYGIIFRKPDYPEITGQPLAVALLCMLEYKI
jgi:hypothetical protein